MAPSLIRVEATRTGTGAVDIGIRLHPTLADRIRAAGLKFWGHVDPSVLSALSDEQVADLSQALALILLEPAIAIALIGAERESR